MASGLQVFNENGVLLVDTSTWTGRILGIIPITASSYNENDPNFTATNQSGKILMTLSRKDRPFYFCIATPNQDYSSTLYPQPIVVFTAEEQSGGGFKRYIEWGRSYGETYALGVFNGKLLYGVY